jgi:MYXO-CTERM domain-containing protein
MRTLTLVLLIALVPAARAQVIDFEDLSVPPAGYYNGSDGAGGFTSRGARFNNSYSGGFASGWSYSRLTDVTTPGFGNQYSAYNLPAGGGDASPTYGIANNFNYNGSSVQDTSVALITLPPGTRPAAVRVTNTTYTALSVKNGDSFAKKFGGPSGNDPDFLLLTVQGRDALGALTGSVDFYLADYRFADNSQDYIVSQWTTVNLSGLPAATSELTFRLTSSDVGQFGINTPAYFALDNLAVTPVPEPAAWALAALGAAGLAARRRNRHSQRPRPGLLSGRPRG